MLSSAIRRGSFKICRTLHHTTRPPATFTQQGWREPAAVVHFSRTMEIRLLAPERGSASGATHVTGLPTSLPLSPAVRYLIDSHALDPTLIPASGPHTRLLKGDVLYYMETRKSTEPSSEAANLPSVSKPLQSQQKTLTRKMEEVDKAQAKLSRGPATPKPRLHRSQQVQFTDIPVDDDRRNQAMISVQSKMALPHSYATIQCHVGSLLSHIQLSRGEEKKSTWLDSYLIKAAALTLQQLPHSNAVWIRDTLHLLPTINVAVRVSFEGKLIPTPVISNANRVSVEKVAAVMEDARAGIVGGSDQVQEAAFMVSSLTSSDVSHYTAVVQPPHSAVLTIAGLQSMCGDTDDVISSPSVSVSLSCDSRVLDSDLASQWLNQFRSNVELHNTL